MTLRVFNTLTRAKEDFKPKTRKLVRIYTCGLTVYDLMHVGHARTYIFWDVFRRYLKASGYEVISVMNYTDIDDKIISRAKERGIDFNDLAEMNIAAFDEDCENLNILPYTVQCRATDYIPEMIDMVAKLVEDGFAYVVESDVYFDVHKFPRYGRLSGQKLDDLEAGSRVEVDERKKHPADFALWKGTKPGEPSWDSPWGKGRPGWHIECSVMSTHFLGDRLDVHGGAVDNMFPHHENEIAQTEAFLGLHDSEERWCTYWMHPEHLLLEETKMSKSLGNFITVHDLLEDTDPNVVRLYFLLTHYRTQMNFTREGLKGAASAFERIENFISIGFKRLMELDGFDPKLLEEGEFRFMQDCIALDDSFNEAMDDDLNCPAALGAIFEFIKKLNSKKFDKTENAADLFFALNALVAKLAVLGIDIEPPNDVEGDVGAFGDLLQLLLIVRADARKRKDFATSDAIRDGLNKLGIQIEDTSSGARLR